MVLNLKTMSNGLLITGDPQKILLFLKTCMNNNYNFMIELSMMKMDMIFRNIQEAVPVQEQLKLHQMLIISPPKQDFETISKVVQEINTTNQNFYYGALLITTTGFLAYGLGYVTKKFRQYLPDSKYIYDKLAIGTELLANNTYLPLVPSIIATSISHLFTQHLETKIENIGNPKLKTVAQFANRLFTPIIASAATVCFWQDKILTDKGNGINYVR